MTKRAQLDDRPNLELALVTKAAIRKQPNNTTTCKFHASILDVSAWLFQRPSQQWTTRVCGLPPRT
jgi:hypothetical protein